MKVERRVLAGLAAVVAPWAVLYTVFSDDAAGSALLVVLVLSFAFVAVYLLVLARQVGPRPEDRDDAEPAAGAGTLGVFPAASIWPVTFGLALTVLGWGLVFSPWVALPGIALALFAVAGWAVEVQRAQR
jgi:hypothetical protein